MKICLVSQEYPDELIGGIGSYTAGMAKALVESGHVVHVLSRSMDKEQTYFDGNVLVHKILPKPLCYAFVRRYLGNIVYSAYVAYYLYKLINKYDIQSVEVPEFAAEGFIYSIVPFKRVPLIVRLHTPLKIVEKINGTKHSWLGHAYISLLNWMERVSIIRAEAVTSPSKALADVCRRELRLGSLQIHVFPNPVNTEYFAPNRIIKREREVDKTVLYVGQLGIRKGVEVFREIIPDILKSHPDANFVFAGADQGYNKDRSMQDYIVEALTDAQKRRIIFLGKIPWQDLRNLYCSARVCVFPSKFENFPQVCLEAMSCGSLVIGSSLGGMVEIISDGVNGFIVEPSDTKKISERICHCLAHDLNFMRQAARSRVTESFSLSIVAHQAIEVIKRVVT
jgi:glycosyltransferase involved in cell wall biosynthesis